jgi:hypothetical protein
VKRVLLFAAAVIAVVALVWFAGSRIVSPPKKVATNVEPPPAFPNRDENETARRLMALLSRSNEEKLRDGRGPVIEYIRREVASPAADPAAPPAEIVAHLASNAQTVAAVRALLLSNPPPVWKLRASELIEPPEPQFPVFMQIFTTLTADALNERSRGNTSAAWADLGALWVITQSLWSRPEANAVLLALTGSRMVNAAASKMPVPPPAWWNEFATYNPRPSYARAMQYEAWAMRSNAERYPAGEPSDEQVQEVVRRATEPILQPIRMFEAESHARELHEIAHVVATATPCDDVPRSEARYWSLSALRLHRFLVEREGVARLLAARAGEDVDESSACLSQRWNYKRTPQGFELAFSGTLPRTETRINVPLRFTSPPEAAPLQNDRVPERR